MQQVTGPDVPVVRTTLGRLNRKTWAFFLAAIGQVVPILQQQLPVLQKMFPHETWLGNAVTLIGLLWLMAEKATDAGNLVLTNYTVPAEEEPK